MKINLPALLSVVRSLANAFADEEYQRREWLYAGARSHQMDDNIEDLIELFYLRPADHIVDGMGQWVGLYGEPATVAFLDLLVKLTVADRLDQPWDPQSALDLDSGEWREVRRVAAHLRALLDERIRLLPTSG